MSLRQTHRAWISQVVALLAIVLGLSQLSLVAAAEKIGNSLDFIPADAVIYSTTLHNKEKLDALLQSNAWAKFTALPAVEKARRKIEAKLTEPGNPLAMALGLLQMPENQKLVALFGDMCSNEVFSYGDETWLETIELLQKINGLRMQSMLLDVQQAQGAAPRGETSRQKARLFLNLLNENGQAVRIPNLILGFKIADRARATAQLKRLESVAALFLRGKPELKDRLQHVQIGRHDYLSLALDGELVPWESFWGKVQDLEDQPGEYDSLLEKLKKLTLAITLGVRDDYLILSIGGSNQAIEKLGGSKRLVDRIELQPLQKFVSQRLGDVTYTSKSLQTRRSLSKADIDQLAVSISQLLEQAPIDDPIKERLRGDIQRIAGDIKRYVGKAGASMAFSLLTDRGFEHYSYNWSENLVLDASKPLLLANHLGGTPVGAVASHCKDFERQCSMLLDWVKIGCGYFDEIAPGKMPPREAEKYQAWSEAFRPLAARADTATRKLLIPALGDGQSGLVLDAKIKSKQWQNQMPPADEPLPMAELALVFAVRDPELAKQAFAEYFAIAEEAVEKLKELGEGKLPEDFKIPKPKVRTTKQGTIYSYALPKEAELDPQIAPNAGLGQHVAVLSFSPAQTARLLNAAPLAVDGPVGNLKRPLGVVGYFNWAALIDAATPWAEYGVQQYAARHPLPAMQEEANEESGETESADEESDEIDSYDTETEDENAEETDENAQEDADEDAATTDEDDDDDADSRVDRQVSIKFVAVDVDDQGQRVADDDTPLIDDRGAKGSGDTKEYILEHVRAVAEILKALGTITSVTYTEKDAVVTHSEWHFQDLPQR